jgi:beta-phosphoglucomutase family hydrolase
LAPFDAILFDLDGVLTPTADVHRRAWAALFTDYLAAAGAAPYTERDYFEHIDGKPRVEGVRDLLASRGLALPPGEPTDPPGAPTLAGLGNRKNAVFTRALVDDGVAPFPGALTLVSGLADAGKALAVVSSSNNARTVLDAAGLADLFPVIVDGAVARAEGLRGKPAPDTFLHAAALLGVPPAASAVIEDAVAGVAAGRAGHFGLVVGVDRGSGEATLRQAGADVIVHGLTELAD